MMELDVSAVTLGDLADFKDSCGIDLMDMVDKIEATGSASGFGTEALIAFVWICGRQADPAYSLADARKVRVLELDLTGMARSTVAVKFTGDTADLKKKLGDVEGGMSKLGGVAKKAAVAGAAGLAVFGASAVKAGSDLEETLSKSNTVFGENAKEIENWSETAAEGFGQSKTQALAAASSFGNMFTQLGIGADQAADMSTQMTELASDFASFHNADITEVLQAQEAAFRGEYDSVQKFVPTINAAAVEQKALEMGLGATTKELDAQDKALATQALLMEGAGDAMGDFDRTSDSLANRQRILAAQFDDIQAKVGQALIPVLLKLADAGEAVIDFMSGLPGPVKVAVGVVGGLAAVLGTTAFAVGKVKGVIDTLNLGKLATNLQGASGGFKGMGGNALVAAGSVGVLVTAAHLLNDEADHANLSKLSNDLLDLSESGEAAGEVSDLLGEDFKTLQNAIEDIANPSVASQAANAIHNMAMLGQDDRSDLENSTALIDDLDASLTQLAAQDPKAAAAALEAIKKGLSAEDAETLVGMLDEYDGALADIDTTSRTAAGATGELGTATDGTAASTDKATASLIAEEEALQGVYEATIGLFDSNLGYRQSIDDLQGALEDLAVARFEEGAGSEAYSDQLLKTEQASLHAADAAVQLAEDQAAGFGVTLTATEKSKIYRDELVRQRDALAPGSPLRVALDGYIKKLDAIPPKKKTDVGVDGVGAANAKIDGLIRKLNAFDQTFATANVQVMGGNPSQGGVPRFAEGGVMPGPKGQHNLASVAGGEGVFTPDQMKALAGGGVATAGLTVVLSPNISVPPTMDAGAAGQAITEALAAYVRRNGANDLRRVLGV